MRPRSTSVRQLPNRKSPWAIDDAVLHGQVLAQPSGDLVDRRQLAGLRFLPLRRPSLDLSLDVALALGEVAQPDRVDIDGVEIGQHIDEVLAASRPKLDRQRAARSVLSSTTPST